MNNSKKLVVALAVSMSLVGGALTSVFANTSADDALYSFGLTSQQNVRDAAEDNLESKKTAEKAAQKKYDEKKRELDAAKKIVSDAKTQVTTAELGQVSSLETDLRPLEEALTEAKKQTATAQKRYDERNKSLEEVKNKKTTTATTATTATTDKNAEVKKMIEDFMKNQKSIDANGVNSLVGSAKEDIKGNVTVTSQLANGETVTVTMSKSGANVQCQTATSNACSASSAAAGTSNPMGGGSLNNKPMQPVSSSSIGGGSLPSGMGGGSLPTPSKSVSNDLSSKTDAGHVQWAIAAMAAAACAAGAGLFIKRRRSLSDQA